MTNLPMNEKEQRVLREGADRVTVRVPQGDDMDVAEEDA